MELRALARRVESPDYFRSIGGDLTITDRAIGWNAGSHVTLTDGVAHVPGLLSQQGAQAIAATIRRLRDDGVHPVFVYVFDEVWDLAARLAPAFAGILGSDFSLLPDLWAWHVDPSAGERGWTPHRGRYRLTPRFVNAWIALTDATVDNGCIHVVPLSRDKNYPDHLESIDFDERDVRPLPIAAGDALVWDANILHFGGTTRPTATHARVSASFTAAASTFGGSAIDVRRPLPFRERLDLIAEQLVMYGHRELPHDAPAMEWARLISAVRSRA